MSDSEADDTELDPRIQIELEKLNSTTDEINRLEIEYDEANGAFRALLNESTCRLKQLSKKIGSSNIERSRCYFELLEEAKRAQHECQEAAACYKKAYGIHTAAKETVTLAEERFLSNQKEWQFDNAWQEMLNHATMKVMEAENQKAESGREHQRRAKVFKDIEEKLKLQEEKFQKSIAKARPYFEEKALCQEQLNAQKDRIERLRQEILRVKNFYAQTLKNLEQISNEIHMKRRTNKQDTDILKGPREPGVGAELNPTYEEVVSSKQFPSTLPDIDSELEKFDACSEHSASVVGSCAVSEKDGNECLEDEITEFENKLKRLNVRPIEGRSEEVYISEYRLGPLARD